MRALLLVVALAGSAHAGSLTGRVVQNKFRVAEYAISIDRGPVIPISDRDGRFTVPDLEDGEHEIALVGWVFEKMTQTVVVKGATDLGDLVGDPGRIVAGHIVDKDGEPIASATVLAYDDPPNAIESPFEMMMHGVRVSISSGDGGFVMTGVTGSVHIKAIAGDRRSLEQLLGSEDYSMVKLVVAHDGKISGTVANRRTVVSPVVWATSAEAPSKPVMAGINPQGHFEIDVPAGIYDLTLDGEYQTPVQVIVVENHTSKAALTAPASHADLLVTANGCYIASLLASDGSRAELANGNCDTDRVRFSGLAPGAYLVCIDGDDECKPVTVRASPKLQTLKIVRTENPF